jgi:hypothetical protein
MFWDGRCYGFLGVFFYWFFYVLRWKVLGFFGIFLCFEMEDVKFFWGFFYVLRWKMLSFFGDFSMF